MITKFEVGKSYRWIGGETRPRDWNWDGLMDFLLDGKPHECSVCVKNQMSCGFIGHENPLSRDKCWGFYGREEDFQEVTE